MKRIVLMPTKNDGWILEKTLSCLVLWADIIIVADQNSTDSTKKICSKFPKVKVIANNHKFHSTKVRQMLLDEARKIEGHNIIFSIDSDEVLTADVLNNEFWENITSKPVGTAFEFQWVQLWRDSRKYRDDSSMWSNNYKPFAFIDSRTADYTYDYAVNDHNSRVPRDLLKNKIRMEMPKVLHYQFVNWPRMLAKQRFYRVQDYVQKSKNFFMALKINRMYFVTKDEYKLKLSVTPEQWTAEYLKRGIDLQSVSDEGTFWYNTEVLKFFNQYGLQVFSWLDIWDKDWSQDIADPRSGLQKFYHKKLQPLVSNSSFLYKFYSKLKF